MAEALDFREKSERNWVRAAYGLKYLKNGIEGFIDRLIKQQHEDLKHQIEIDTSHSVNSCTSCTCDNLLPNHPTRQCIQRIRSKCFCSAWQNRRKCPNQFCSRFYDKIVYAHSEANPSWQNTDPSRWYFDYWELAKCLLGTTGYLTTRSASETDVTGLLSIAINDLYIVNEIDSLDNFEQVRATRNEIFHRKMLRATDEDVDRYIDRMVNVLTDKKHLVRDRDSQEAVFNLNELKQNQIYISTRDAEELRNDALACIQDVTEKSKNEIEGAKQMTITDMELKAIEIATKIQELANKATSQISRTVDERSKLLTDAEISGLQKHLLEFYRNVYCRTDISPLVSDEDVDVDKVYVPVQLEGIYKDSNTRVPIQTVEELLCLSRGSESFKNIFIYGGMGLGKTTFCKRLVSLWCRAHTNADVGVSDIRLAAKAISYSSYTVGGEYVSQYVRKKEKELDYACTDTEILQKFDFVFVVSLRYAKEDICIEEMIETQLYFTKLHSAVFNEVISSDRFKCLVIVDGLDEWNVVSTNRLSPNFSQALPRRRTLGYTIVYTTRPWKTAESKIKTSEISLKVYCSGIAFDSSIDLVSQLEKLKDAHFVKDFFKNVKLNNLQHFMTTPLLVKLIYAMWVKHGGLPNSRSMLYCEIHELLLQYNPERNETDFQLLNALEELKHKSKDMRISLPSCFRNLKITSDQIYLFHSVSIAAFRLYFKTERIRNVTFNKDSILECGLTEEEFQICLKVGLLTQEKAPSTPTSRESAISFTHFSFQEFLVAACIALQPTNKKLKTIENVCLDLTTLFEMSNIISFVYGMYSKDLKPFNDLLENIIRKHFRKIRADFYRRMSSQRFLINLSLLYSECTLENKYSGTYCNIPFHHLYLAPETYESIAKSVSDIKPTHLYCYGTGYWWHKDSKMLPNMLKYILANNPDRIETLCLKNIDLSQCDELHTLHLSSLSSLALYDVQLNRTQMNALLCAPKLRILIVTHLKATSQTPSLVTNFQEPSIALSSRCSSLKLMQISYSQLEYIEILSRNDFTNLCVLVLTHVSVCASQARNIFNCQRIEKLHLQNVTCSEEFSSTSKPSVKSVTVVAENKTPTPNSLKSLIVKNTNIYMFHEVFTIKLKRLENLELQRVKIYRSQANDILTCPKLKTLLLNKVYFKSQDEEPEEDLRFLFSCLMENEVSCKNENVRHENLRALTITNTDISFEDTFLSNETSRLGKVILANARLSHTQATHALSSPRLLKVKLYNVTCNARTSFSCQYGNCKMTDTLLAHIDSFPLVQKFDVSLNETTQVCSILTKCWCIKNMCLASMDLGLIQFENRITMDHLRHICLADVIISRKSLCNLLGHLPSKRLTVSLKYITFSVGNIEQFQTYILSSQKFTVISFKGYTRGFCSEMVTKDIAGL